MTDKNSFVGVMYENNVSDMTEIQQRLWWISIDYFIKLINIKM